MNPTSSRVRLTLLTSLLLASLMTVAFAVALPAPVLAQTDVVCYGYVCDYCNCCWPDLVKACDDLCENGYGLYCRTGWYCSYPACTP